MREFQDRRRTKKLLHSRYAIAILVILIVLVARGVWGIYLKYEKSQAYVEKARADLTTLQNREKTLEKSINALNTEEGKEKELRDRFGLIKEGERMVILVDSDEPVRPSVNVLNDSWWDRFLDTFGL
jgi:cell division protein FtsB